MSKASTAIGPISNCRRRQQTLLEELAKLGKPIVLVTMSGSALAIPWAAEHIPAIVQAWYPGQAGGQALADVLFGDYNPGGTAAGDLLQAVRPICRPSTITPWPAAPTATSAATCSIPSAMG